MSVEFPAEFDPAVFVPQPGTFIEKLLVRGSAIVGRSIIAPRSLLVYFEGNKYGASNMVTLADRAMFAYWRMRDAYPTIAKAAVDLDDVMEVGTLHVAQGIVAPLGPACAQKLADWLDLPDFGWSLEPELRVSGVRV